MTRPIGGEINGMDPSCVLGGPGPLESDRGWGEEKIIVPGMSVSRGLAPSVVPAA